MAEEEDFDAILDMCAEFWLSTQFKEPFDRAQARLMVEASYSHGLLAVSDENGIIGFIAAIKSPLLASTSSMMATELAWWVDPKNRHSKAGIDLVKYLERLCKKQGVSYLNMAFMETSMPERIKKLYVSMGYSLQETVYTKVI